jgi:ABC-type Zn uptake system ZnuABC Zn-binding protein ZnuA
MKHAHAFLLTSLFLAAFAGCTDNTNDRRPLVVTSIRPLAQWIQGVAGERVRVLALLPPNANPHTFELLPRQIEQATSAELLVFMGAGMEPWGEKLRANISAADPLVLQLSEGETLLQDSHNHHDHEGHAHGGVHALGNPHLWLDPQFAMRAVERIRQVLSRRFPALAAEFRDNAARYIDSLRALDADIARTSAQWTHRAFVADHSSWPYFAARYTLRDAGAIESQPGREISAREMAELTTRLRSERIRALFVDVRSNSSAVKLLAEESGARIVRLDPLGGVLPSHSYMALMRANVEAMSEALR